MDTTMTALLASMAALMTLLALGENKDELYDWLRQIQMTRLTRENRRKTK